jgi:hypothetical protein
VKQIIVIPNAARVQVEFGGILNSLFIWNTSTTPGAYIDVYVGNDPPFRLTPGRWRLIEPSDTSMSPANGKICTYNMSISGQVTASVSAEVDWSTKFSGGRNE